MFFKKFLSILTYFVWKKVWLLKFSIFSKKKFWKNFSGLTGKICPDSPEKFVRTHRKNFSSDVLALNLQSFAKVYTQASFAVLLVLRLRNVFLCVVLGGA